MDAKDPLRMLTAGQEFYRTNAILRTSVLLFFKPDVFMGQGGLFWVPAGQDRRSAHPDDSMMIDDTLAVKHGASPTDLIVGDLRIANDDPHIVDAWYDSLTKLIQSKSIDAVGSFDENAPIVVRKGRTLSITLTPPTSSRTIQRNEHTFEKTTPDKKRAIKDELLKELKADIHQTVAAALKGLVTEPRPREEMDGLDPENTDVTSASKQELLKMATSLKVSVKEQDRVLGQFIVLQQKRTSMVPKLTRKSVQLEDALATAKQRQQKLRDGVKTLERGIADTKMAMAREKREFRRAQLQSQ